MTLSEFKAWFSGYTEGIEDKPTQKQWDRIKARVDEIDNMPTTERIYIDRYYPLYRTYVGGPVHPVWPYVYCSSTGIGSAGTTYNGANSAAVPLSMASNTSDRPGAAMNISTPTWPEGSVPCGTGAVATTPPTWDSAAAMLALGKEDARADAA